MTYVEVAAGGDWGPVWPKVHTVLRRSDGSVVAWGDNQYGQCNVPAPPAGLSYVEVAAGLHHTVARRSDGSVVAWGWNNSGQCIVPPLPAGLSYVEVAAGDYHTVARRSDGSVIVWGGNVYGQLNVPALPAGLSYVEVDAGGDHTVARRSDGSVVAWGPSWWSQGSVPALPAGMGYVEVAVGTGQFVARLGCDPNSPPEYETNNPAASLDLDGVQGSICTPAVTTKAPGALCVLGFASTNLGLGWEAMMCLGPLVPASGGALQTLSGQLLNVNLASPAVLYLNGGATPTFTVPFPGNISVPFWAPLTSVTLSIQSAHLDPTNPDGFSLSQGGQLVVP
jgi:hypothetical protein